MNTITNIDSFKFYDNSHLSYKCYEIYDRVNLFCEQVLIMETHNKHYRWKMDRRGVALYVEGIEIYYE